MGSRFSPEQQPIAEKVIRQTGLPVRNVSPSRGIVHVGRAELDLVSSVEEVAAHAARLRDLKNPHALQKLMEREIAFRQEKHMFIEGLPSIWVEAAVEYAELHERETTPEGHGITVRSLPSVMGLLFLPESVTDDIFESLRGSVLVNDKRFDLRSVCPISGHIKEWVKAYTQVTPRLRQIYPEIV